MLNLCLADICRLLLQPGHVYMVLVKHSSDRPIYDQITKKQGKKECSFSSNISSEWPETCLTGTSNRRHQHLFSKNHAQCFTLHCWKGRSSSLSLQAVLVVTMSYVPGKGIVIHNDIRRIWFSHWSDVITRDSVSKSLLLDDWQKWQQIPPLIKYTTYLSAIRCKAFKGVGKAFKLGVWWRVL